MWCDKFVVSTHKCVVTDLANTMTAYFCPNNKSMRRQKDTIVDHYIDLLVTLFSNYNHCPFWHARRQNYVNVKTDHNITVLNHNSSREVRFSSSIVTKQNIRNSVVSVECMNRVQWNISKQSLNRRNNSNIYKLPKKSGASSSIESELTQSMAYLGQVESRPDFAAVPDPASQWKSTGRIMEIEGNFVFFYVMVSTMSKKLSIQKN